MALNWPEHITCITKDMWFNGMLKSYEESIIEKK